MCFRHTPHSPLLKDKAEYNENYSKHTNGAIIYPDDRFAPLATILPPPANQFIGINDGVFLDLVEDDCRLCHENPDQYPVEDETLPNRHHLLTGTEIPDPTDAPYGTPGGLFAGLTCHEEK